MFSGSSRTTVSVLEPVMRSFVSLINFERKYMKAKVKTRTDFWASLCFRENKKKFNSRVPKPQAARRLYLTGLHPMSWKKPKTKPTQPTNTSTPSTHPPCQPTCKDPGKCMTVSLRFTHASPYKAHHTTLPHKHYDFGAHSRFYLLFSGFDEQMCDLNQTNQGFTHWTLSKTMRQCTATHHCRCYRFSHITKGQVQFLKWSARATSSGKGGNVWGKD